MHARRWGREVCGTRVVAVLLHKDATHPAATVGDERHKPGEPGMGKRHGRRQLRRRKKDKDAANPFEYADKAPSWVSDVMPLATPTCAEGQTSQIPNTVTSFWLGGGKLMFAKLLAMLSVHLFVRPEKHVLLYDEPDSSKEWQCACLLASCQRVSLRQRLNGHDLLGGATDRYASDRLGRCGNAQLDVLRLDTLLEQGGVLLDLDVFALRPLDAWRRCAPAPVVIGAHHHAAAATGGAAGGATAAASATAAAAPPPRLKLNPGVVLAAPQASFVRRWRESYRDYSPSRDFGDGCNATASLAAAAPAGEVHAAAALGPLPRYRTRDAYERHIDAATLVHLSAFRHPWRLHDVTVRVEKSRPRPPLQRSLLRQPCTPSRPRDTVLRPRPAREASMQATSGLSMPC